MRVEVKCPVCHNVYDVYMTDNQYKRYFENHELVQDVFPDMNPGTRELLISGVCPDCWDKLFIEE